MTIPQQQALEALDNLKYEGANPVDAYLRDEDGRYYEAVIQQCWESWQAAIQHARDVAVKACKDTGLNDAWCFEEAIKEALK